MARAYFPPMAGEIAEEVELVMLPRVADPVPAAMDLPARQVVIQHADVVNVDTVGNQQEGG